MATSDKLEFVEYDKQISNPVWKHFLRDSSGTNGKCKVSDCGKILKMGGGSTSGLIRHLKSKHKIELEHKTDSKKPKQSGTIENLFSSVFSSLLLTFTCLLDLSTSSLNIRRYFEDPKSLSRTISKMCCLDGIPFYTFEKSEELRLAIKSRGFKDELPKSRTAIKNMVTGYAKHVRQKQIDDINRLKDSGSRFSLIFDEWTSTSNRRYMNMILTSQEKLFNLGLIRLKGSITSVRSVEIIEQKLVTYKLNLKRDIISIITDGTSVMTKIGTLIASYQQLCLAHGVQLAVTDVLYSKTAAACPELALGSNNSAAGAQVENEMENPVDSTINCDSGSEDEQEEDTDEPNEENYIEFAEPEGIGAVDVDHSVISPLIQKVRRIVKLFRKSPLKDEVLQKYVKADHGKELKLLLDSKTRWSSLFIMLERFVKLRNGILKSLIDVKANIIMEEWEFDRINDLVKALEALKISVEALCREDATLLTH